MPLTPFIGLSVFVHIGIIVAHKLFKWSGVSRRQEVESTPMMLASGYLIIFLVFSFVSITAGALVRASLVDSHSSVRLIEYSLVAANAQASTAAAYGNSVSVPVSSVGLLMTLVAIIVLVPYVGSRKAPGTHARYTESTPLLQICVLGIGFVLVVVGAADLLLRTLPFFFQ